MAARQSIVAAALRSETGNPSIAVATLDLASLRSVRAFIARFPGRQGIAPYADHNAGLITRTLARTADGFEAHFGVHHLGHFALTMGLFPALRAAGNARVVSLTSVAHQLHDIHFDDPNFSQCPYEVWPAYGQSKTATALFSVGLHAAPCGGRRNGQRCSSQGHTERHLGGVLAG
jgi:NAD(P)-dependent dehydrogenase (short-subunit alcohol dehydrogenase family)